MLKRCVDPHHLLSLSLCTCVLLRVSLQMLHRGLTAFVCPAASSRTESLRFAKTLLPALAKWLPSGKAESVQKAKTGTGNDAVEAVWFRFSASAEGTERTKLLEMLTRVPEWQDRDSLALSEADVTKLIAKGEEIAAVRVARCQLETRSSDAR